MASNVEISIELGDALAFQADVLVMKYAQAYYGLDEAVAQLLQSSGVPSVSLRPGVGNYSYINARGRIAAANALFVGVPTLSHFAYPEIRQFATDALKILAQEAPATEHLAMTIHGVGYGLDEVEACLAQVEGYVDAMQAHGLASALRRISIVDRDSGRVSRLRQAIAKRFRNTRGAVPLASGAGYSLDVAQIQQAGAPTNVARTSSAEAGAVVKPHVFVAMSFSKHLDDVFHYGIQVPVRAAGYVCERMDRASFTGEIINSLKHKIETASVVIAELSGANPNVYLEVGYAWGKERPTILVSPKLEELAFDVRGHRCLLYDGIQDLEDQLARELSGLQAVKLI